MFVYYNTFLISSRCSRYGPVAGSAGFKATRVPASNMLLSWRRDAAVGGTRKTFTVTPDGSIHSYQKENYLSERKSFEI